MLRKGIAWVLSILLVILAVSCTESAGGQKSGRNPDSASAVVTDHLGRNVELTKKPERIVSGYYISTSAVIALGLKDKLVGIEAKADTRPIYRYAAPELLELPNVGTAKEFDLEGCISLRPDLVILPVKLKDQIQILEDMGIAVIGVNPESQKQLAEMIEMIAALTGSDKSESLLSYYEQKEKELMEIREGSREQPKVYLAGNSSMLSTASKNMYQNDLIEAAGGINAAGSFEDAYWVNISYEQLNAFNPDLIVIAPEAEYTLEDVLNDSNIQGISAIQNKRVYQMPNIYEAWDSPVPSGILGKLWLASVLHGDIYTYDRFVEDAYEFYNRFYGFQIDKEALKADGHTENRE